MADRVRSFLQPVAMGVLLGQGWHVYSEVFMRGSGAGIGLCTSGMVLGLLLGIAACVRASQQGQVGLRLSLFWMSCTLNGGLSAIAQLRLRVGRFRANDDALVMNSFLSSGLLGTCLPHMVLKVLKQPEAEVLMPCVLGLLMTEAICSSEAMPLLQVVVSIFLCGVGVRGMMTDAKLTDGAAGAGAHGDRSGGSASGATGVAGGYEPFFPATAMDKRCYSPHFLVSRRAQCVPRHTSIVPLISLVTRQAAPEPQRGGSGGKGSGAGGRDRGAGGGGGGGTKERSSRSRAEPPRSEQTRGEQAAVQLQAAPQSHVLDAPEVLRPKPSVEEAEVGENIRWDVIFEEMRRVDNNKSALPGFSPVDTDAPESLYYAPPDSTDNAEPLDGALDGPIEVFAELAAEGDEDVDDLVDQEDEEEEANREGEDNGEDADGEEGFGSSRRLASRIGRPRADLEDDLSDPEPPCNTDATALDSPAVEEVAVDELGDPEIVAVVQAPEGGASSTEQGDEECEETERTATVLRENGPSAAEPEDVEASKQDVNGMPSHKEDDKDKDLWASSRRQEHIPEPLDHTHGSDWQSYEEKDRRKRRDRGDWKRGDRRGSRSASDRRKRRDQGDWKSGDRRGNRSERYLEELEKREREREDREREARQRAALDRDMTTKEARQNQVLLKASEDDADIDDIEELEVPLGPAPSGGLKLIELGRPNSSDDADARHESEEELDLDVDDDIIRSRPQDAMELTLQEEQLGTTADAQEDVPVVEDSSLSTLRADAEAFCPPGMSALPARSEGAAGDCNADSQGVPLFPEAYSDEHSTTGAASVPTMSDPNLGSSNGLEEAWPAWGGPEVEWAGAAHGSWAASDRAGPAEVGATQQDSAGVEKGFNAYRYAGEAWNGYGYGGEVTGVWDGYAAGYGDGTEQNFDASGGYGYEAGNEAALGSGCMSANAAEFVPGSAGLWASTDDVSMGIDVHGACYVGDSMDPGPFADERHMHSRRDPVMSLIDSEVPDPGLGRASAVRRPDAYGQGKGKGRGRGHNGGGTPSLQTLWVSDIEHWMTESYISDIFSSMAMVTSVKVIHRVDYTPGYALVEFASQNAAAGVLESLAGEPVVSPDGQRLYASWASEMMPGGEGLEGRHTGARGSDGTRNERRNRRERDRREDRGKGGDSRGEAADDRGKGQRGAGRNGRKGDAAEADGHLWRSRGDGAGAGTGKDDSSTWAYVDPKDQVQTGFSLQDMRKWYESGYFDGDLSVALCRDRRGKVPHKSEFYKLRQWYPDLSKSFTYVPKF